MAAKDNRKIQEYLEHERNRLVHELASCTNEGFNEYYDSSLIEKRDEIATQRLEMERLFAKMRRIEKQIVEIDRALEKIKVGSYGLCDRCVQQIPVARLAAIPQTSFCLECKGTQADHR